MDVVGAVASILQIIHIGTKICVRINDFRQTTGKLPKAYSGLQLEIPILLDILRITQIDIDTGQLSDSDKKVLGPVIEDALEQFKTYEETITKALPKKGDSGFKKGWKGFVSLKYESKIKDAVVTIKGYIQTISNHTIASERNRNLAAIASTAVKKLIPGFVNKPFQQDRDFVERDVLAAIISQTHRPDPVARLALVGIGGVGKSQIAIEYAYRILKASPETWVFWVQAGSIADLDLGYREIARAVGIPGHYEKETDIFKDVYEWLSEEANGRWVMILDNADELSVFTAPPPHKDPAHAGQPTSSTSAALQIQAFLPKSCTGSILIISRNRNVAFELTGNFNYCLELNEMNESEAILLLKKKLQNADKYKDEDMVKLVHALDLIPLAISQAAAYISRRAPRVTVASYTEGIEKENQALIKSLEEVAHEPHRNPDRSNSVLVTCQMSCKYVRETSPSAARLLSFMCLFDRLQIQESLLKGRYEEVDRYKIEFVAPPVPAQWSWLAWWLLWWSWWSWWPWPFHVASTSEHPSEEVYTEKATHDNFEEDLAVLTDLCIIKMNADGSRFSMHRLVQWATIGWLEDRGELKEWQERFVSLMSTFPDDDFDSYYARCLFFPHARRVLHFEPPGDLGLKVWAPLMRRLAQHAQYDGHWEVAEPFLQVLFNFYDRRLGADHERTLATAVSLGMCLGRMQRWDEAETLLRKTMEKAMEVLGPAEATTVSANVCLASVLKAQGRFEESDALDKARADIKLTTERFDLSDWGNSADLFFTSIYLEGRGKNDEAQKLQRRVCESVPKDMTAWDGLAFINMKYLGLLLFLGDEHEEAESVYRQVLLARKTQGEEDVEVMLRLGEVLGEKGKFDEAEDLCRRAVEDETKSDGAMSESLLAAMEGLAQLLSKRGKYEEAEDMSRSVLAGMIEILGEDNLNTLHSHRIRAEILVRQGKFDEALACYKISYEGLKKMLGEGHFDTQWVLQGYMKTQQKVKAGKLEPLPSSGGGSVSDQ